MGSCTSAEAKEARVPPPVRADIASFVGALVRDHPWFVAASRAVVNAKRRYYGAKPREMFARLVAADAVAVGAVKGAPEELLGVRESMAQVIEAMRLMARGEPAMGGVTPSASVSVHNDGHDNNGAAPATRTAAHVALWASRTSASTPAAGTKAVLAAVDAALEHEVLRVIGCAIDSTDPYPPPAAATPPAAEVPEAAAPAGASCEMAAAPPPLSDDGRCNTGTPGPIPGGTADADAGVGEEEADAAAADPTDWEQCSEDEDFLYSATAALFFHVPTGSFYDAASARWCAPGGNEWVAEL